MLTNDSRTSSGTIAPDSTITVKVSDPTLGPSSIDITGATAWYVTDGLLVLDDALANTIAVYSPKYWQSFQFKHPSIDRSMAQALATAASA